DHGGPVFKKPIGRFGGEVRMLAEISITLPVTVPSGVNEHGLARNIAALERGWADGKSLLPRLANDDTWNVGDRLEHEFGEIRAVRISVERTVEICAGVGDHVDPPDLEGRTVVIICGGTLALPEVADMRPRQAFVGDHAVFDHMAEVDDLRPIRH